jgi:hypothetical protein
MKIIGFRTWIHILCLNILIFICFISYRRLLRIVWHIFILNFLGQTVPIVILNINIWVYLAVSAVQVQEFWFVKVDWAFFHKIALGFADAWFVICDIFWVSGEILGGVSILKSLFELEVFIYSFMVFFVQIAFKFVNVSGFFLNFFPENLKILGKLLWNLVVFSFW